MLAPARQWEITRAGHRQHPPATAVNRGRRGIAPPASAAASRAHPESTRDGEESGRWPSILEVHVNGTTSESRAPAPSHAQRRTPFITTRGPPSFSQRSPTEVPTTWLGAGTPIRHDPSLASSGQSLQTCLRGCVLGFRPQQAHR